MSQVSKTTRETARGAREGPPIIAVDIPVMYEDEGQEQMGETQVHTTTADIIFYGVTAHLVAQPRYRVFSNLNCYYHPTNRKAYFSSDVMVVVPTRPLRAPLRSYRLGPNRPAPVLTVEVLSQRSLQQQDLSNKPNIYADVGVSEYILADVTGEFLPQRLLLKRLRPGKTWSDEQDPDGGVTSHLGFGVFIDTDCHVRVVDARSGKRYIRPGEAQAQAEAHRQAEERIRELQAELDRLKGSSPEEPTRKPRKRRPEA